MHFTQKVKFSQSCNINTCSAKKITSKFAKPDIYYTEGWVFLVLVKFLANFLRDGEFRGRKLLRILAKIFILHTKSAPKKDQL